MQPEMPDNDHEQYGGELQPELPDNDHEQNAQCILADLQEGEVPEVALPPVPDAAAGAEGAVAGYVAEGDAALPAGVPEGATMDRDRVEPEDATRNRRTHPLNHHWGSFHFTFTARPDGASGGQWECHCRWHAKSARTGCKKTKPLRRGEPFASESTRVLWALRHWATRAKDCQTQAAHVGLQVRIDEVPPRDLIASRVIHEVPAEVVTDDKLHSIRRCMLPTTSIAESGEGASQQPEIEPVNGTNAELSGGPGEPGEPPQVLPLCECLQSFLQLLEAVRRNLADWLVQSQ